MTRIDQTILTEDSYSADHFDHQVKCNMTELSQILRGAKDSIFTVQFKRKVQESDIIAKLEGIVQ